MLIEKRGFTLVEILIVVLIIALLALLVIPNLAEAKRKAVRSRCIDNLRQLNSVYQQYFLESSSGDIPPVDASVISAYFQSGVSPVCPLTDSPYSPPAVAPVGETSFPTCPNAATDRHSL